MRGRQMCTAGEWAITPSSPGVAVEPDDRAQPAGDRRPGLAAVFEIAGEAFDVDPADVEQTVIVLPAPGSELAQIQGVSVSGEAAVGSQESEQRHPLDVRQHRFIPRDSRGWSWHGTEPPCSRGRRPDHERSKLPAGEATTRRTVPSPADVPFGPGRDGDVTVVLTSSSGCRGIGRGRKLRVMSEAQAAGWLPDPRQSDRLRYWDGHRWTDHVSENGVQSVDPLDGYKGVRWQYAVINLGMFKAMDRMQSVLGSLGSQGWEIAAMYDKQSNWMTSMEKGFVLLKRPVAEGATVADDEWCITVNLTR